MEANTRAIKKLAVNTESKYAMFSDILCSSILNMDIKALEDKIRTAEDYFKTTKWLMLKIGATDERVLYYSPMGLLLPDWLTYDFDETSSGSKEKLKLYNFKARYLTRNEVTGISYKSLYKYLHDIYKPLYDLEDMPKDYNKSLFSNNDPHSAMKLLNKCITESVNTQSPNGLRNFSDAIKNNESSKYIAHIIDTLKNEVGISPENTDNGNFIRLLNNTLKERITFEDGESYFPISCYNYDSSNFYNGYASVMPCVDMPLGTDLKKLFIEFRKRNLKILTTGIFTEFEEAAETIIFLLNSDMLTDGLEIDSAVLKKVLTENRTIPELDISMKNIIEKSRTAEAFSNVDPDKIKERLLSCDTLRADIDPYDEKILSDPNRGHWELWDNDNGADGPVLDLFEQEFVARDPAADINRNRIAAIDFGTKSTVVVYQNDDSRILPMRVGTGNVSKSIQAKHYENPTIIEFNNLEYFMKEYNASKGRPMTLWEHVCISHKAVDDLQISRSVDYSAFLSELKQWAGNPDVKNTFKLRDRNGKDHILKPFTLLGGDDIDPVELYAYYLGLYINNMRNGIFLNYYLSFPVTYEPEIRNKILKSFEKGLKKSLPESLLNNGEIMKDFKINGSISEPAAYAVCALQEYGFEPDTDNDYYYAIFDFGGGTADFDFGVWKESSSPKYDYTIKHFGANGDRYLGGENILALMAFSVFRDNEQKLRDERITFTRPPMCPDFAGSETLISGSRESGINMRNLVEKLRPIWENTDSEDKNLSVIDESGSIKVNLFRNDGSEIAGVSLAADKDKLSELIKKRIEKGIDNFFTSLFSAYGEQELTKIDKIYIILAGNSSKSGFVTELFNEKISHYTKEIRKSSDENVKPMFALLPPIGSEEFKKVRAELHHEKTFDNDPRSEFEKPTGKTGVAFGLIECRKGGRIEIISSDENGGTIPFRYYVGTQKKRRFKVLGDASSVSGTLGKLDYGKWCEVFESDGGTIEIYYTTEPEAVRNDMPIENARRLILKTDAENSLVFVRAADPHTLEYVSANSRKDADSKKYIGTVHRVTLE